VKKEKLEKKLADMTKARNDLEAVIKEKARLIENITAGNQGLNKMISQFVEEAEGYRHNIELLKVEAADAKIYRELNRGLHRSLELATGLTEWDPTLTTDDDLVDLIRWLALSYQGNDPIFMLENTYGHALEMNRQLARTWFLIVRGEEINFDVTNLATEQATPETPGPQEER
jgi:hypothetical protein